MLLATLPLSVQLYTVRDRTAVDFAGTVRAVAKLGLKAVELGGTYGNLKTAAEAKKALDDAGLKVSGAHAPIEELEGNLQRVLDDNDTLANKNVICPWIHEHRRKDAAGWKQFASSLNTIGRACHERGFVLCYHNHSFEFQKFDGKIGLDILFENTDPHLVKSELDVYWVKHGGGDPVEWINKLAAQDARCHLLHLKDMAAGADRKFAEVGSGILDWKAIFAAAEKGGVQWGALEQDDCYGKPTIEALKTMVENLKRMGLA